MLKKSTIYRVKLFLVDKIFNFIMQTYYRLNTNPMKLAVVTNFTPSKSNVSEYGYHLAKNFAKNQDVSELIVFTENSIDQTNTNDYIKINGCTVKINECNNNTLFGEILDNNYQGEFAA